MARKTIVSYIDDLDGKDAAGTLHFGVDGINYEIDLSMANLDKFRKALSPFVVKARKVGKASGNGRVPARARVSSNKPENDQIRAWARGQRIPVKPRGRIPEAVVRQYRERDTTPPTPAKAKARSRQGATTVVPATGEAAKVIRAWWQGLSPDDIVRLQLPAYSARGRNVPTAVQVAYEAQLTPAG